MKAIRAWLLCLVLLPASLPAGESRLVPISAPELASVLEARQGQVVLVNFWATWCRPCLEEIPALLELADRYAERNFALVAVSLDEPEALEAVVEPFMQRWFPQLQSYIRTDRAMDATVGVVDPAWNEVLPTSYVLDPGGKIAATLQGGKSAAEFAAAIEPFLTAAD